MLPYTTILEPQFVPAPEVTFLQDDDISVGVVRGNVAKAFPAADLAQHGSVNDQMPDGPIEVTWCGVCNTGAVFRAQIKRRILHFDYDSMVGMNEVHKDRETGTRWQQSTGEAISGPLKGSFLVLYPFVRTTWKEWRRRYPNTVVLKPLPGYAEIMPNLSKRIKQSALSNEGAAPKGAFGNDDRLRPRETVAGLRIGSDAKAFPFAALRIARVVNDRVGGVPVLVVHQPSSDTTTAFEARANGKVLRRRPGARPTGGSCRDRRRYDSAGRAQAMNVPFTRKEAVSQIDGSARGGKMAREASVRRQPFAKAQHSTGYRVREPLINLPVIGRLALPVEFQTGAFRRIAGIQLGPVNHAVTRRQDSCSIST
jgi:hypothetical protein